MSYLAIPEAYIMGIMIGSVLLAVLLLIVQPDVRKWCRRHKRITATIATCTILFVAFIYPFGILVYQPQSCTIAYSSSTVVFFVQRCSDSKEAMEGRTVVLSTHYIICQAHIEDKATRYYKTTVLEDFYDACEHNPEQNHTIAIGYDNKTGYDFWSAKIAEESDRVARERTFNASYANYLDNMRYQCLEIVNAKDVQGYYLGEWTISYTSTQGQLIAAALSLIIIASAILLYIINVYMGKNQSQTAPTGLPPCHSSRQTKLRKSFKDIAVNKVNQNIRKEGRKIW